MIKFKFEFEISSLEQLYANITDGLQVQQCVFGKYGFLKIEKGCAKLITALHPESSRPKCQCGIYKANMLWIVTTNRTRRRTCWCEVMCIMCDKIIWSCHNKLRLKQDFPFRGPMCTVHPTWEQTKPTFDAEISLVNYVKSLFSPPSASIDDGFTNIGYYCHRCFKTSLELVTCDCDVTKMRLLLMHHIFASQQFPIAIPQELRFEMYRLLVLISGTK